MIHVVTLRVVLADVNNYTGSAGVWQWVRVCFVNVFAVCFQQGVILHACMQSPVACIILSTARRCITTFLFMCHTVCCVVCMLLYCCCGHTVADSGTSTNVADSGTSTNVYFEAGLLPFLNEHSAHQPLTNVTILDIKAS